MLAQLKTIRELWVDPTTRATGVLARDNNGASVAPTDPTAVCWCLLGAIHKVELTDHVMVSIYAALWDVRPKSVMGLSSLAEINDQRPDAVLGMLDTAICREEWPT